MCQVKIQELEMKLQEEEYQRKLVQDKANQVNRIVYFVFSYHFIHVLTIVSLQCCLQYLKGTIVYCFTYCILNE